MTRNIRAICFASSAALMILVNAATTVNAQERGFFSPDQDRAGAPPVPPKPLGCKGPITQVMDIADESWRTTKAVFGTNPGGGEGGQFDKTPVLTTTVTLAQGTCLDAHLSVIVGSKIYGASPMAVYQVTLTRVSPVRPPVGPVHMVGHYHTPFGHPSPAIGHEAERDVDMLGANFFQRVGTAAHEVPPGTYRVDVWWAGAPPSAPGGAVGAAFVLKLYLR